MISFQKQFYHGLISWHWKQAKRPNKPSLNSSSSSLEIENTNNFQLGFNLKVFILTQHKVALKYVAAKNKLVAQKLSAVCQGDQMKQVLSEPEQDIIFKNNSNSIL